MDFIDDLVIPGFMWVLGTAIVLGIVAGVVEAVQYARAQPAERACHVQRMGDERLIFRTDVKCVPLYRGADSLNVTIGK